MKSYRSLSPKGLDTANPKRVALRVKASSASSPRRLVVSSRWREVKIGDPEAVFLRAEGGRGAERRRRTGILDMVGRQKRRMPGGCAWIFAYKSRIANRMGAMSHTFSFY